MNLDINQKELLDLMENFHILTGIFMILVDVDNKPILRYPDKISHFCQYMKETDTTKRLCDKSDHYAFESCKQNNKIIIYLCHAGLIEVCAPLKVNNTVIGYLMFGQISDYKNTKALNDHLQAYITSAIPSFHTKIDFSQDIPLKSKHQIQAAAKIMEACTAYVILKDTVRIRKQTFITNMNSFLLDHLDEELNVTRISKELGISKSKLYQLCEKYLGKGIAAYILDLRMEHAGYLLRETKIPISAVASNCGFNDYPELFIIAHSTVLCTAYLLYFHPIIAFT